MTPVEHAEPVNVDSSEISKFEALANRWWDPDSEFKPLHDMNPLRLEYIAQRAALEGARVLDIGCGGGILTEAMAKRGAQVVGIDLGTAPLTVARLHARESGIEVDYRQIPAEQLASEQPGEFDVVTCLEMLEHVPDPASIVAAAARLVRPGGQVFFSTINRNPRAWLAAIVGAEYVLRLLPRGTHHYAKLIRPSELSGWCRHFGLDVRDLIGIHYNPFSRSFSLKPGVEINYLAHCTASGDSTESTSH
ncbi:MAG: ubiquinone biosynthesis O-methyltransferase [marine bacterium B5-7]|nr:MAG: ubiquinone biosynthesis O-methyltransferase [marine bacterium B5-7]